MNVTKTALMLGITILGLMGTIHYMSKQDTSPMMHIHDAVDGLKDYKLRVELFKNWMQEHQKSYSVDEYHMRFAIWNKVYDYVQEHNAMNMSWTAGLNQFSDLTSEEFAALHLGLNYDPNRPQENVVILDENDIPNDIDWRAKGAVNPIENQGSCGSCYTYSSTGALESLYFINKGVLTPLSKQQLLDCTKSYGNQGCNGGWMTYCFKYTQSKGSMKASDYKYTGKVGTCAYSSSKVVFKNTAYAEVTKNNPTQLKAATNKGTVTVAVQANQAAFQNYKSGVITSNCGTELDHAVLVVGYAADYWIVRNSWGTSWGDKGYLKIAIGTQNNGAGVCGINGAASYPTA